MWLAWLTGVLAISTVGLWVATILTLRHNRETAERQLRAYVSVFKSAVGARAETPGSCEISITIRNSGQTPAYAVSIWADMLFDRDPLNAKLIGTKDPKVGKTSLPPGQKRTSSFFKGELSEPQKLTFARDRTAAIYVWGEIRYVDAFKKNRWTKFRFIQRGGPEFRDQPVAFCEDGNEEN